MSNTITTGLSIAPPTIAHFKWVWDSNPWDTLMLHSLLPPHRQNLPLIILRLTKPLDSLREFSTSTNKSRRFCRNPMLNTRSAMINTGYHTSFRLATKFGYICRRSISLGPIGNFSHFFMGLTLSPRLWVVMLLISTLHPWSTSSIQCGPPSTIFSTIIGHFPDCRTNETNKSQP
jgi:hypothetical protein